MDEKGAFDRLRKENEQLKERIAELEAEVERLKKITPHGGGGPGEER